MWCQFIRALILPVPFSIQLGTVIVKAGTHKGACSLSTFLQHAPGAKLPRLHQRKNMLHDKTFAPKFCSLISNWFDVREQAPGANLLHESVSVASSLVYMCTEICLRWHDMSPVGQSKWLIFFIHNSLRIPIGLFHHSSTLLCPSCVLVGVLTRECVLGACFRSKLPRVYWP